MEVLFLKLVNMSITASWLVLAVLLVRLVLRRAPRRLLCALWGLVALRLLCPFSLESALSLIPSSEPLPPEILRTGSPEIHSGVTLIDNAVNPVLSQSLAPELTASANPTQIWSFVLSRVWLLGAAAMVIYALVSYLFLKRRLAAATALRDNIMQSSQVDSPFVLGVFRPVIYLPYSIRETDQVYVISHEQAHIMRRDHWWKPLGFLLLSVYWFNPVMWAAYALLCRDIEAACDEKVIGDMETEDRRAYSTALLNCSVRRRRIAACPLAFGEVGVKARIKSVMHYKKPAFWLILLAVAVCAVVAVCFLTDPPDDRKLDLAGVSVSDPDSQQTAGDTGRGEPLEDSPLPDPGDAKVMPVAWVYSPSAVIGYTWLTVFTFHFDLEYTHIEVTCDKGELWNLRGEGQPRAKTMEFDANGPIFWDPQEGDSETDIAPGAALDFTMYNGAEKLNTGRISITGTGADDGTTVYEARMTNCEGLVLHQRSGDVGGTVITREAYEEMISPDTVIYGDADLDHDGRKETIHLREAEPEMLCELSVVTVDGTLLWSIQAAYAHAGWNTILLYEEDGKDYLIRYLPTMFQGYGGYSWTQFHWMGDHPTVVDTMSVEFELPLRMTVELRAFAEKTDRILQNCTLLVSTEQGELVVGPKPAVDVPQIYPVQYVPEEILSAMEQPS